MLIEFARNVLGLASADHAETNPNGSELVIAPLACSLVEQRQQLRLTAGSRLAAIYGSEAISEEYHCRYGPSLSYRERFENAGFRFTAFDEGDEPRAGELLPDLHPFFLGTLFQSERGVLSGVTPPLVRAFLETAGRHPHETPTGPD